MVKIEDIFFVVESLPALYGEIVNNNCWWWPGCGRDVMFWGSVQ